MMMVQTMVQTNAIVGIILFAIGGTWILLFIMVVVSSPSQFGDEALADTLAIFFGMLILASGLYLIIESASKRISA